MAKFFFQLFVLLCPALLFAEIILNVKDFGARADGKSDDTKAIQAAINSADPSEKTTLFFPAGIYHIASFTITSNYLENYCLKIHSNIHFKGQGNASIIRLADYIFASADSNANAHLFYGKKVDNISYSNFMIDMNGQNNLVPKGIIKNNAGIFTSLGNNVHIEKISIKNCSGTNMINIMSKGQGLVIKDCTFFNGGNYVGSAKLINDNQIDFSFVYSEWDNTVVSNCSIFQQNIDIALADYTGGIELHGNNSSIYHCDITGCFPAIYISSTSYQLNNIRIYKNRLINCAEGISFWIDYPMQDIYIEDNIIELTHHRSNKGNMATGIKIPNGNITQYTGKLANAAPVSHLQISRNNIYAPLMKNLSAGMLLHSLQNSSIKDNIIKGMNYAGIALLGSKWGIQSLLISNNQFVDFNLNQDADAVAGYIVVTDTYTPLQKNAPGLKNILFQGNKFIRKNSIDNAKKIAKGKFLGAFIALPKAMQKHIQFKNNYFSDKSEKIHTVITD